VHEVLRHVDGEPLRLPNFPAFGPDGALYVTASGGWAANDGRVVRLRSDGGADTLTRRLDRFPNGCAVTPDGGALWVVESYSPTVNRVDLASGAVEVVARLDGTVPDGVVLTEDGGLLVTCYRPDRIYHLDARGRLEVVAEDPQGTVLAAPTNACFLGPGLDRLAVANLGRWHLTLLDPGLRGLPLHHPLDWAFDASG
jgi:gluconolactonase